MLLFFRHHLKLSCSLLIVNHTPLKMISDKAVCIGPHVILENSPFPPTKIQLSDSCSIMLRREGCKSSLIFKAFDWFYRSSSNFHEKLCGGAIWSLQLLCKPPIPSWDLDILTRQQIPVQLSWCRALNRTNQKGQKRAATKSLKFLFHIFFPPLDFPPYHP